MSDDGSMAIVIIALIGSPFSPAYARARADGAAERRDPLAFSALNVAVYAGASSRWSLRERALLASDRGSTTLRIGRSTLAWTEDALVASIAESTTPFGRKIRGRVTLRPEATTDLEVPLDRAGLHRWWPVAPLARIEVELDEPRIRFRGHGYHDANAGDVPLESSFDTWCWSRARSPDGALLSYAVREIDGAEKALTLGIDAHGRAQSIDGTSPARLPRTRWGLERSVHTDHGATSPRLVRTLEDGPFYARALVDTRLRDRGVTAMHEVLSGARLARGWVRFLAGFRMGRTA